MRCGPWFLLVAVTLTFGCTSTPKYTELTEVTEVTDPATPSAPSTATDEPASATVADGPAIVDGVASSLVLVLDGATLTSYRSDGSRVAAYATGDDLAVWQPIWAPDGRRVAWTRITDGASWELVTAAVDGSDRTVHPLPGRPDYITYDPTATTVLALTPSPAGFGLVVVDLAADTDPYRVVDVGVPYFSDIAPDGDRLVAHVGGEMRIVDLGGSSASLGVTSLGHQTPAWHPRDDAAFFTVDEDAGNVLVAHDLATGLTKQLASFDDFVLFDVDPSGTRLAVSAIGLPDDGIQALRSALGGGVWIVEVADGSTRRLGDRPTAAPMWDPTGTRVLARTAISGVGSWVVHHLDGNTTSTARFDVDRSLLPSYLPFWDQYARSQTLWSPDGGHFVHVGTADDGRSGVWVHDAGEEGPSRFLVEGDLAFWSPT